MPLLQTKDDSQHQLELFRLLGLGQHVTPDELRSEYETAMSRATRGGDLRRAMHLLTAFEGLSEPRRRELFGRTFSSSPSLSDVQRGPQNWSHVARHEQTVPRTARTSRRSTKRTHRERKWGMSLTIRVVLYTLIAPAFLFAAWARLTDLSLDNKPVPPSFNPPAQQVVHTQAQVPVPRQSAVAPAAPKKNVLPAPKQSVVSRPIPRGAPSDAQRFVIVRCDVQLLDPSLPDTSYGYFAHPGSTAVCTNGATPRVIR